MNTYEALGHGFYEKKFRQAWKLKEKVSQKVIEKLLIEVCCDNVRKCVPVFYMYMSHDSTNSYNPLKILI